jgi:ketosteroid isomerase-like protein
MSRDNVEIVREIFATESADLLAPGSLEAFRGAFGDLLADDFEIRWPATWPEGEQVFRGQEGAAEISAMLGDSWAEWRVAAERFLDAGDRVVVFVRIRAQGVASGAEVEFERAQVWRLRDGRAVSMEIYVDRAEAVEAVGLRE